MPTLLFWLGYLWALPVTLVGALVVLVGGAKRTAWLNGAALCVAQPGGLLDRWFRSASFVAFTWGGVVIFCDEANARNPIEQRHELRHFAQARVLGPFMPLVYVACSIWALVRGRDWYWGNALEEDARAAEGGVGRSR